MHIQRHPANFIHVHGRPWTILFWKMHYIWRETSATEYQNQLSEPTQLYRQWHRQMISALSVLLHLPARSWVIKIVKYNVTINLLLYSS